MPDFCALLFDEFDHFRAKARLLHLWPGQPDHDCDQEEHLLRETERQVQRADNARPEVDSAEEHVRDVPHTRCHPIRHQVEELRLVLFEERPIANGFREEETLFGSRDLLLLLIVVIVKELATKQRPDRATRYEQILQEHDQVNWKFHDFFSQNITIKCCAEFQPFQSSFLAFWSALLRLFTKYHNEVLSRIAIFSKLFSGFLKSPSETLTVSSTYFGK